MSEKWEILSIGFLACSAIVSSLIVFLFKKKHSNLLRIVSAASGAMIGLLAWPIFAIPFEVRDGLPLLDTTIPGMFLGLTVGWLLGCSLARWIESIEPPHINQTK